MSFTDVGVSDATGDLSGSSEGLVEDTSTPSESYETPELGTDTQEPVAAEDAATPEYLFEVEGAQVTLDEARSGYLRQADYTRKTQELATERSRLQQAEAISAALERDPVATLQALQEAFGVNLGQPAESEVSLEDVDPVAAELAQHREWIAEQQATARNAAIDAELADLHQEFGEFDAQELFTHTITGGFPSLRSAYADMNLASLQERLAAAEAKKADEDSRRDAARQAAVVHTGQDARAGAASAPAQPSDFGSFREAYLAARKSHGL